MGWYVLLDLLVQIWPELCRLMVDLAVVDAGEVDLVGFKILRGVSNGRVTELEQHASGEQILAC